jgi:hypothetical protein
MVLGWPLAVRWLHDALIEDLLDNAELAATGTVRRPARWSPWVRMLRAHLGPTPRGGPVPPAAALAHGALPRVDFADAWSLPLADGMPADPAAWTDAIFRRPPAWVVSLLAARNALVRLVGIAPGDRSAFDEVARTGDEVLVGSDAGHLDFRASVLVADRTVTLSTVAMTHNARGRAYMTVVRRVHPAVVRGMLTNAARYLAALAAR